MKNSPTLAKKFLDCHARQEEDEKSEVRDFEMKIEKKEKRPRKKYADNDFMARQGETDEEMAHRLARMFSGRPSRNRRQVNRWQPREKQDSKKKKTTLGKKEEKTKIKG